ncbi:MAG: hypothetical protein DMG96_42260 [Acidobacteria bacterium]|nr:MAG: hypothetical protein DMG96_42260 [Acidobacteriota bacterium]
MLEGLTHSVVTNSVNRKRLPQLAPALVLRSVRLVWLGPFGAEQLNKVRVRLSDHRVAKNQQFGLFQVQLS